MVNTYVVAPNFSMAPPPRLFRPDETALSVPPPAERPAQAEPPTLVPSEALAQDPAALFGPFSPSVELQLGDVLVNPFGAELVALNRDERVPIDSQHVEEPGRVGGFSDTRRNLLSGRLGVLASLLAAFGVGPEINVSIFWESKSDDKIEVAELLTWRFRVTDEYVKEALAAKKVQKQLEKFPKAPLYMVSGMKIAKGAKQNEGNRLHTGADAGGGDGAGAADLKLLKLQLKRSRRTSFEESSDFIMAVQLRHIKFVEGQQDPTITLSTSQATMKDGKKALKPVAKLELEGTDDSLEDAEDRFPHSIDKKRDNDGDYVLMSYRKEDLEDE